MILWMAACQNEETGAVDTDDGAVECGASEYWDVQVRALVQDATGAPLADLPVTIEERNMPRSFGSGTTGPDGVVEFTAEQVESVPGCWGLLLDYWIVVDCDGTSCAEDDMNTELYNAIEDGSLEADVTGFPLVVE